MTAASTLGVHHFASFFYLNPPKWKTFVHTLDQLLHGCCQCLLLYCFQEKLFTLWASSLLLSKSSRENFSKSFRKPSYYTHSSSSCASNMLLWRRPVCADSCTFAWPKHACMHACIPGLQVTHNNHSCGAMHVVMIILAIDAASSMLTGHDWIFNLQKEWEFGGKLKIQLQIDHAWPASHCSSCTNAFFWVFCSNMKAIELPESTKKFSGITVYDHLDCVPVPTQGIEEAWRRKGSSINPTTCFWIKVRLYSFIKRLILWMLPCSCSLGCLNIYL